MKKILPTLIGFYLNFLALLNYRYAGRVSFRFFCRPMRTSLKKNHVSFLAPAKAFALNINNVNVQVYKWGEGPTKLLFIHGWQSHAFRWKNYIDALNKNEFTIYALDAPGHGMSGGSFLTVPLYAEAVHALLKKIGKVEGVVTHSLGSFTAAYLFAHVHELQPAQLVMLAPPAEVSQFVDVYKTTVGLSKRALAASLTEFERVVGRKPDYFSVPTFVKQFNFSGLIVHDEEDTETPVENARKIHQNWSNTELVITRGRGHNLRSAEVVQRVVEFVSSPVTSANR